MREIKFRFWDIKKTYSKTGMIYDGDFGLTLKGEPVYLDWGGGVSELPDFVVMEYIGLKDRNSKDIYEGDIVKVSWLGHEPELATVEYGVGDFVIKYIANGEIDAVSNGELTWFEVVGNIYENPELLQIK